MHGPDSGPGLALPLSLRPEGVQGPGSARVKGEGTGECHPSVPCGEPRSQTRDSTPLSDGGGRGAWWGAPHTSGSRPPHGDPSANLAPEAPSRAPGPTHLSPSPSRTSTAPVRLAGPCGHHGGLRRGSPGGRAEAPRSGGGLAVGHAPDSPTSPTSRRRNRPVIKPAPPCGLGLRVLVGSLLRRISRGTPSWGSRLRVRLTFAQGAIAGMGDPCSQHRSGGLCSVD